MNIGIGAATAYQWLRFLQAAAHETELKTVLVSLNFAGFNANYESISRNDNGFKDEDMIVARDGVTRNLRLGLIYRSLFTVSAVEASYDTLNVSIQAKHAPESGRKLDMTFYQPYVEKVSNEGQFRNMEANLKNKHLMIKNKGYDFVDKQLNISTLESLRQIVNLAHEKKFRLILIFEPSHERTLRMIHSLGLWPKYEMWKREIVKIVDEANHQFLFNTPVSLFDFSVFSTFASEAVPQGERSSIKYWPEGLHYTFTLGDMILEDSVGTGATKTKKPGEFGIALSSQNIEDHLAVIRSHVE